MPWKQKLTADLICALLGNAINKLFSFVIIAVLARYIDKSSMGEFFFAISVTSIVAMLTELGTSRHLVREIAGDRTGAAGCLAQVPAGCNLVLPAPEIAWRAPTQGRTCDRP